MDKRYDDVVIQSIFYTGRLEIQSLTYMNTASLVKEQYSLYK